MSNNPQLARLAGTFAQIKSGLGFDKRIETGLSLTVDKLADRINVIAGAQGKRLNRTAILWAELVEALERGVRGRALDELIIAMAAAQGIEIAPSELGVETLESLESEVRSLFEDLGGALAHVLPQPFSLGGLLEKLSALLLDPPRGPDQPCRAPAPLLRDLLAVALGRVTGGLGAIIGKVGSTVQDLLLPAAAKGDDLDRFVQAILDDPVTAALNLVLGMRNQIDCEVTARKDVGESVIEAGFKRLVGFVEKVLA